MAENVGTRNETPSLPAPDSVKVSAKNNMTIAELLALPVSVPIVTAGRAFGLSRDGVYDLRKRDAFPCRTIKVGRATVVPRAELLRVLGISEAA
jgi:hypothetical protein